MNFTDFGFDDDLMDGIESMGYKTATPVQAAVIPHILDGKDIIAAAQTGTGKTAAFLLPLIQNILWHTNNDNQVNAMVIVPTRELAVQIVQILEGVSYYTPISCIAVYGGGSGDTFAIEKKALSHGVDVVVCTPGRMISHLNMGYVKMQDLKYLVLDEADRMLDMGFYEDIVKIISHAPKERQNLMFSATMPPAIRKLANTILKNPEEINIAISRPPDKMKQGAYIVYDEQKIPLVKHILKEREYNSVLIFCSSKQSVKQLTKDLKKQKLPADEIHSDLEQDQREQVLINFKSKQLKILVATDILSRGIDIEDIELVINYDVPHEGEDYIHRIGRTARAASTGTAYTFINDKEQFKFHRIEQLLGRPVEKLQVPAELGPTPEIQQDFKKPGGSRNKNRNNKFKRKPS
ncbi:MAG: DEAD/DEAH box helicase [Chitinophagales bacterium]|nr:DEAD/DEAH box helicase [Chitinophagales bacterium]